MQMWQNTFKIEGQPMTQRRIICPAQAEDLAAILTILQANQEAKSLIRRPEAEISRYLADFILAKDEQGHIPGCAALHRHTHSAAEIFSVVVLPSVRGQGIGSSLVKACVQQATERHIRTVWLSTQIPAYFSRFEFKPIPVWQLPPSILLSKLLQILRRPFPYWLPALRQRQTIMRLRGW